MIDALCGVYARCFCREGAKKLGFQPCSEGEKPLLLPKIDMVDVTLGRHTIRSHGMKVARLHMHDWVIFLVLIAIDAGLNFIEPFHRFVGDNDLSLAYPFKGNTIPFWAVPLIAILLPLLIFLGIYFKRKDIYDLHHGTLGIFYSVLITAVITDAIKDAVGRPRPDFYGRCFPPLGINRTFNALGDVICRGAKSDIKEGHKSFPSGHSSWSFAGLSFLSWYLAGKLRAFDRKGHIAKLCIVFAPLLCASLVAVSRVDDYWHHWQDVFAGGLLGLTVASFCYLQFFPAPYHRDGWGPFAYFEAVALGNPPHTAVIDSPSRTAGRQSELGMLGYEDGQGRQRGSVQLSDDIEQGNA